jgi:hypothetical protein
MIIKMGGALKEKGEDPKKYRFSVYQRDYNHITIVRKPDVLRDFYVIAAKKR